MFEPWIMDIGKRPGDFKHAHPFFQRPGELEQQDPTVPMIEHRIVVHYTYVHNT